VREGKLYFTDNDQVVYVLVYSLQYLNSGAGGLAGAYIHEKHSQSVKPA